MLAHTTKAANSNAVVLWAAKLSANGRWHRVPQKSLWDFYSGHAFATACGEVGFSERCRENGEIDCQKCMRRER